MGWMALLGLLLVLAEFEVECVRKYIHIMAYRSGRAFVTLFAATICITAAPSEVDIAYITGRAPASGQSYVTHVDWSLLLIGILLAASAAVRSMRRG
jgi:hypothetical protein